MLKNKVLDKIFKEVYDEIRHENGFDGSVGTIRSVFNTYMIFVKNCFLSPLLPVVDFYGFCKFELDRRKLVSFMRSINEGRLSKKLGDEEGLRLFLNAQDRFIRLNYKHGYINKINVADAIRKEKNIQDVERVTFSEYHRYSRKELPEEFIRKRNLNVGKYEDWLLQSPPPSFTLRGGEIRFGVDFRLQCGYSKPKDAIASSYTKGWWEMHPR